MSDPIDIKTKKIITSKETKFNKSLVLAALEQNLLSHWDTWGRFQQTWTSNAYRVFKDLEKYIILMLLVRNNWQSLSDKFSYMAMDEFYDLDKIIIDKINLIEISKELEIPKETIRRKVNELQREEILSREGKSISFNKKALNFQKPEKTIDLLSTFIEKKAKIFSGESWFGDKLEREEIKLFIKKYFTIFWLRYFKLQISFLIAHRNIFRDLETWMIWGNIGLHHQYHLQKKLENSVLMEEIRFSNYYKKVANLKVSRGINASSISEISQIPRATVIRKLKWLVKEKVISKNKNLEYSMTYKGNLNKVIEQNFTKNQHLVADFLCDVFDLMQNSKFKI